MTNRTIIEFKNKFLSDIISNDLIIKSMGNLDIEENDEAIYKYVFPYFNIPDTIEAAHSYICMKVNMIGLQNENDLFGDYSIIVWVIVNQEIMRMGGVGGATRMDYISDLVEELFNGSDAFGTRQLKLISNLEEDLDYKHRCRKMTFSTLDISNPQGC